MDNIDLENTNTETGTEFSLLDSLKEAGMTAGIYIVGTGCALAHLGALNDVESKVEETFPGMSAEERDKAIISSLNDASDALLKDPRIQPPIDANVKTPPAGQIIMRLLDDESVDLSGLSDTQRNSIEIAAEYAIVGKEVGACVINKMGGDTDDINQKSAPVAAPLVDPQQGNVSQPLTNMNFDGTDATYSGDSSLAQEVSQIMEVNPNAIPAVLEQTQPTEISHDRSLGM